MTFEYLRMLLSRLVVLTFIWLALAEADWSSWWIGIPVILALVALSTALVPPTRVSWPRLAAFLPYFALQSVRGGVDVALRTLNPRLAIDPGIVSYRATIQGALPQTLFVSTVNLLPGTLIASLHGNDLTLHVLDQGLDHDADLHDLEMRLMRMFGQPATSTASTR